MCVIFCSLVVVLVLFFPMPLFKCGWVFRCWVCLFVCWGGLCVSFCWLLWGFFSPKKLHLAKRKKRKCERLSPCPLTLLVISGMLLLPTASGFSKASATWLSAARSCLSKRCRWQTPFSQHFPLLAETSTAIWYKSLWHKGRDLDKQGFVV